MANTKSKFIVTFAGGVGSSKTPIANKLSGSFGLPVFNSDAIRTEVTEDLGKFDQNEYLKRRTEREKEMIMSGLSFILDISVDRIWEQIKKLVDNENYLVFLISMNLSKEKLVELYKAKGYLASLERIDQIWDDHEKFLAEYGNDVNLSIADDLFSDRLILSEKALGDWINKLK